MDPIERARELYDLTAKRLEGDDFLRMIELVAKCEDHYDPACAAELRRLGKEGNAK